MNMAKAPKPKPIALPAQQEDVSQAARAISRKDLRKKRGYAKTALAGETGGYGGTTALS